MRIKRYLRITVQVILLFSLIISVVDARGYQDGSVAARQAIAGMRIPDGFKMALFAAEPQLFNPVAFCLDEQGKVYVAEEHRFLAGTPENRSHSFLLEDDLQLQTLDDRLAMQKKWAHRFPNGMKWFTQTSDIVRLLEDRDGDGVADRSTVFADGFNGPLDGLGSGLIARDGKVWYTCIPHLWQLSDEDGDGKAEHKTSLLRGFGVNAAFYGHDLHGLVWGVDGKLYFSVGDRGAHVVTKEGKTISNPRTGAVYRCNSDGSELELVHRGLRNPQELAFDQYGNLFAVDNNCDNGDHSRLVYIVEGGDSGWNMAFQTIPAPYVTGPWNAEGMWKLSDPLQPAYIVPPVGKIGAGPSGFTFYSGTSMPRKYRNLFYYCNYTGNGGIESFRVEEQGAGFKMVDHQDFCKPVMASDVDFGYDGKMYIAEYQTNPFDRKTSGGRIYTLSHTEAIKKPEVEKTKQLFMAGFSKLNLKELSSLLHHDDMRVRLRAQFTLADKGKAGVKSLFGIALNQQHQLARLHAIWGLGQIGQKHPEVMKHLRPLLVDDDPQVVAQVARVIGDVQYQPFANELIRLLEHPSARVRYFTVIALGQLKHRSAIESVIKLVRANNDSDRYLRHAAVHALTLIGDKETIQAYARDTSPAVRMVVLLVQRRLKDGRLIQFLNDAEVQIVTEAARAVNDLPMLSGREALAGLAQRYQNFSGPEVVPLMRRIINANFQLGEREHISALVDIVTSSNQTPAVRKEALSALGAWGGDGDGNGNGGGGANHRDRVTGVWRPVRDRDLKLIQEVIQQNTTQLLAGTSGELQTQVTQLLNQLEVETDDATFANWALDRERSVSARVAAVALLSNREYPKLADILDQLLESDQPELRAEAREQIARLDSEKGAKMFEEVLGDKNADMVEKQRAIKGLGAMKSKRAEQVIDNWAEKLAENHVPPGLQLDLIEVLTERTDAKSQRAIKRFNESGDAEDPLSSYRTAIYGGNSRRGKELFVTAYCIRCHSVNGRGGVAGPDLSRVFAAERQVGRAFLLESIIFPNKVIASGYGLTVIELMNGETVAGTIKHEDEDTITLMTPDNQIREIKPGVIKQRLGTLSSMPPQAGVISLRDLRDLVAYLSTLD